MNLPNRESAYVPLRKLSEYLLSETHPVGRSKARLLLAAGFNAGNVESLAQGLIAIANSQEITESEASRYGTKYVIDGVLQTPHGGTLRVRTVWIIDAGQDRPRFVTAYPL